MAGYDFNQSEGLFMVGIPDKKLILLRAIANKLGLDIPTVIARSIVFMARSVLSEAELIEISKKIK